MLLPGHLLMRFTREKLEDCLAAVKDGVSRDVARSPEAVNLQVGVTLLSFGVTSCEFLHSLFLCISSLSRCISTLLQ